MTPAADNAPPSSPSFHLDPTLLLLLLLLLRLQDPSREAGRKPTRGQRASQPLYRLLYRQAGLPPAGSGQETAAWTTGADRPTTPTPFT